MAHGVRANGTAPAIDWQQPWFAPVRQWGASTLQAWREGATVHAALNACTPAGTDGPAIRFAPQSALAQGVAYEAHVFAQRECPTRDNLHDFFNGLCWLCWPRAKRRINELQAAQIARDGVQATRGPVRDTLTLLDENGAVLLAPPPLWRALRARDWQDLFVGQRALWPHARLVIIGHALLEKLVHPRKDLTAHVWGAAPTWYELGLAGGSPAWEAPSDGATESATEAADSMLAAALEETTLADKPLTPLPLMGIPGWDNNACPSYYDDVTVFRPPRPVRE